MNTLLQDIRYGLRALRKQPGFTAIAVLALALGIGANTTIFSTINALLLHPFNFRDVDRIVAIWETRDRNADEHDGGAFANYLDIRNQTQSFESTAAWSGWNANLTEGDQPERIEGAAVSPQFFSVLAVQPAAGRAFLPEEEQPGHDPTVIISDGLWRRRFGADPSIVGRNVRINERAFIVVGVMPQKFLFPRPNIELWTPLIAEKEDVTDRGAHYLQVIARLKPGAALAGAQSELDALARSLAEQYPATNANRSFVVESLLDSVGRGPRPYMLISLGAVLFVLLIACANVANLQLMRATARQREIAVRLALGASRWRIIQQLLTESVLLALAGGLLGLLLSVWAVDAIAHGVPAHVAQLVSGWEKLRIDWRVFGFTLLISLVTGIVFGLAPAVLATRTNLNEALKEGGRTGTTVGGRGRLRALLMISEVALSLVLLVGAGLMVRSFISLLKVQPGFNGQNVVTMSISLPFRKYTKPEQSADFYAQLLARVRGLPGVQHAAAVNVIPFEFNDDSTHFQIEGRAPFAPGSEPFADFRVITPDYFNALDIPLLQGRAFNDHDTPNAPRVAIISAKMARRFFAGQNPLGQRLRFGDNACEIVGGVGDVRYKNFIDEPRDERLRPAIYVPHAQLGSYRGLSVVVRAAGDPAALTAAVRTEVQALDKDQPIYNVRTLPQVFVEGMAPQRLTAFMFAGFALVALLLAAVGLYAVISYSVAQRTHEIGIRMALGAQAGDVFRLVIGQGLKLIAIGVAIGLVGAFALTRVMVRILYGVSATDFVTFAGISLLLALVALAACYLPARRAAKVDPMIALRYE
ncbi:MAG: permease [Acidobacteria bacterium]|nr:MAG: permease [Acidobacteriota bacterium]